MLIKKPIKTKCTSCNEEFEFIYDDIQYICDSYNRVSYNVNCEQCGEYNKIISIIPQEWITELKY
jgi:uncharacterized Zn finger protein